jgi:DNA-directed RNA polymerase subunit RPC12/RpoP
MDGLAVSNSLDRDQPKRCPACRTKIVIPDPEGLVVKNAILRVSARTGRASAKCPRCKAWVEVPLTYHE